MIQIRGCSLERTDQYQSLGSTHFVNRCSFNHFLRLIPSSHHPDLKDKMSFEPKQKVELDPPKDDLISKDYLSKCDGR